MPVSGKIVDEAVENRIQELRRQIADQDAAQEARNDDAIDFMSLDAVPADIEDDKLVSLMVLLNTDRLAIQRFKPSFIQDFQTNFLPSLQQEPMRLMSIISQVNATVQGLIRPQTLRIEPLAVPPAEKGGAWTLVVAPLYVDVNNDVGLPDTLDMDLSLSLQVAPRPESSLSEEFNVPAMFIPAGQPARPLAINYTPASPEEPLTLLVQGYSTEQGLFGRGVSSFSIQKEFNAPERPKLPPGFRLLIR